MDLIRLLILILFLFSFARLSAQGEPKVEARLDSAMVVVGEETYLTIWTEGVTIIDWPDPPPDVAPLALKRDQKRRFQIDGYIREGFRYRLAAFQPGVYQIPPFVFRTSAGVVQSDPLVLHAHPVDDLVAHGIDVSGTETPYLTGLFLQKKTPFVGEIQEVEAKLYLSQSAPNRLKLADGKVIKIEKEGLAAWRFTTLPEPSGFLDYEGQRFVAYAYRSVVNALREGSLTLGPGKAEAVFFQSTRSFIHPLNFPSVDLQVRPLPDGAPAGFAGAVGSFTMKIAPLSRDLEPGDALTVEATIVGTGNFTQFPGPTLDDPEEQWKTFEMIAKPNGGERRKGSGRAEFSQVVRPKTWVASLPPYRFVFFDPVATNYQTLESPAIPLTMTGATGSGTGASGSLPFLTPGSGEMKSFSPQPTLPVWIWQLIPAGLALFLVTREIQRRWVGHRLSRQPAAEFTEALGAVADQAGDRVGFYRAATRLATKWQGETELDELYQTRDALCFRPDRPSEPVPQDEKERVLQLLRTLAPALMITFFFFMQTGHSVALPDDPAAAREEIFTLMARQPAAEHFYNLALCEKALGNEGTAVLWAYRFELQGGEATGLLADLPGIRREKQEWLPGWITVFSKETYLQIAWGGIWGVILLVLAGKFYDGKRRPLILAALTVGTFLAILVASLAWFAYPQDISFEPLRNLSVVTESSPLRSQPFEGGTEMVESLEGSLCKIGVTRAGWSHLTLPGGLTGWIPEEKVTSVVTNQRP